MVIVAGVIQGSWAKRQGIVKGDAVVSVSGRQVEDLLDLHYLSSRPRCTFRIRTRKGIESSLLYRESEGVIGIIPEPVKVKRCKNKCIFCFVHQLPKGLRRSLYVKDEDYRLSFLSGNYVTFSDVTDRELKKIINYRLSPLYVSIHTTDNALRRKMLGNQDARDIVELLTLLTKGGITLHGQIVLVRGVNDGALLSESVRTLEAFHPQLATCSLVPVGITKHRKSLPGIEGYDRNESRKIVRFVEKTARENRKCRGEDFIYASDEFYLKSGHRIPSSPRYGDYPQLENGVGLMRQFINGKKTFSSLKGKEPVTLDGVAVTGVLAWPYVNEFIDLFNNETGSTIRAVPVENRLLGSSVTVAGLVSGRDIAADVRGKKGKYLFVPSVMLREEKDRFLDDVTPSMLTEMTGKIVVIFEPDPMSFYEASKEILPVKSA